MTESVWVGGGIVWRRGRGGVVGMVLVQRLADGDWSFPKGRLQPGGIVAQAVLGQVEEETGLWCRRGLQVGPSADRDLRRLLEGWRPAVGEVSSC